MVSNSVHDVKILDVGSGTGAVSLCLAHRLKENNVQITGIDIQPELVELSNRSAELNHFGFLQYHPFDIREPVKNSVLAPCSFDIVISNPPYSDHDMPSPNKSKAAAHNLNRFNLTQWLQFCLKMAKPFGRIYLVNRVEAVPEICCALQGKAENIIIRPVYSKSGQSAKRILLSAQKDSKTPCRVLEPFVVHEADGRYTADAQKILREGFCF